MDILVFKIVTIPILTWFVSWVQHRFSHQLGGVLSGLPLTAGPILVFLSIEQGQDFARQAAINNMAGYICLTVFVVTFFSASLYMNWITSLGVSVAAWFGTCFAIGEIPMSPLCGIFIGCAGWLGNFFYARHLKQADVVAVKSMRYELLIRSVVALAPLFLITGIAHVIGPRYSGMLSAFPVTWSVIFAFTLVRNGRPALTNFFRGTVLGAMGYMSFMAALIFVPVNNLSLWFGVAVLAALVVSGIANKAKDKLLPAKA